MTDPNRLARQLAHDATTVAGDVRRTLDHLRLITPDGYPTRGEGGGSRGGVSRPVENMALNRTTGTGPGYRPADVAAEITRQLTIATMAVATIRDLCAPWNRNEGTEPPAPRCSGSHLDGALVPRSDGGWHDPNCEKPAELYRREDGGYSLRRDGLCEACYGRRRRFLERVAA